MQVYSSLHGPQLIGIVSNGAESCMGGLPGIFTRVSKDAGIDNVDDDNCDDNDKVVSKIFVKSPGFSLYRLDLSGHGTGDYGQVN